MMSTHTKLPAGKLVAIFVDDALGRRLVLAHKSDGKFGRGRLLDRTLVLASTRAEARDAITALQRLSEELPP